MKRGEIVQGKVIKVSFPNKGIIETAEGDRLRVKGVLPGQTVSVRVKKASKEKVKQVEDKTEGAENTEAPAADAAENTEKTSSEESK